MEASAPGRARRGRRQARAAGFPLFRAAVLLLCAFAAQAPPAVGQLIRLPRGFHLSKDVLKIVGSPNSPELTSEFTWGGLSFVGSFLTTDVNNALVSVKVYVMLHQRSPHILCVTQRLRNSELIDPLFQWHGPKGKVISENSTTHITSTGSLVFQDFEESMTGVYTCFLEYKPTVEEVVKNLQLKFIVYAYREPRFYYQFTARYHAAPCNSVYNVSFENKLLQILSKLVHDLSCEVALLKSECHHVKMQKAGFQNELFFKFAVSCVDTEKEPKPCEDLNCDYSRRLSKRFFSHMNSLHLAQTTHVWRVSAKNLIERFFNQQVTVLGRRAEPLPEIYYIEDTLQMVWINRCFPGYGINTMKHPKCPECCVICSPGSYNPSDGTHCLQCNSSLAFGAKACL